MNMFTRTHAQQAADHLEYLGIVPEALDRLVQDVFVSDFRSNQAYSDDAWDDYLANGAAADAARITREGLVAQLEFLLEGWPLADAWEALNDMVPLLTGREDVVLPPLW